MVKISCFTDEASYKLDEQIKLLHELGESYMCPRIIDNKNITNISYEEFEQNIKPRLDKNNIKFSSIGSGIGKIPIYDDEAYQSQLEKLKNLVKIAKSMDCKYIRIFSFFVEPDGDYDKYFNAVVKKLKGFLNVVKGSDIILLHENEKRIFGDTPERVIRLYNAINHPQFKLAYDASNYIQCNVEPLQAYFMVKPYTVYYHMKDCLKGVEVPLGMGQGHIAEILEDLTHSGYNGFLTLEPHTAKYACLKRLFYICPLFSLKIKNSLKVYREIDKQMNIKPLQKVTRKQVYLWQYNNLKNILAKVGD